MNGFKTFLKWLMWSLLALAVVLGIGFFLVQTAHAASAVPALLTTGGPHQTGDPVASAMALKDLMLNPELWAVVVSAIFPFLFDLLEQLIVYLKWDWFIDSPTLKRVTAWVLSGVVSILALVLAYAASGERFTYTEWQAFMMAIFNIVISQLAFLFWDRRNMLLADRVRARVKGSLIAGLQSVRMG